MVRRQADIFFLLFILALAGVFLLIAQRTTFLKTEHERRDAFVNAFIPKLRIETIADTLEWYVIAGDSLHNEGRSSVPFSTTLTIPDIGPEDEVEVKVFDVYRDGIRKENLEFVSPGKRRTAGAPWESGVIIPLLAQFDSSGIYTIYLTATGNRIRTARNGYMYKGKFIDSSVLEKSEVISMETATKKLTVVVYESRTDASSQRPAIENCPSQIRSFLGHERNDVLHYTISTQSATIATPVRACKIKVLKDSRRSFVLSTPITKSLDTCIFLMKARTSTGGWNCASYSVPVIGSPCVIENGLPIDIEAGKMLHLAISNTLSDITPQWNLKSESKSGFVRINTSGKGYQVNYSIPIDIQDLSATLRVYVEGQVIPIYSTTQSRVYQDGVPIIIKQSSVHIRWLPIMPTSSEYRVPFYFFRFIDQHEKVMGVVSYLGLPRVECMTNNGWVELRCTSDPYGIYTFVVPQSWFSSSRIDNIHVRIIFNGQIFSRALDIQQ